ncbi:hypothetical protein BX070DRAFT_154719 [Coemansia spiralis]|nr:hypothetical protein BX070DRAFT_154719 [Coemansia spiralis]
MPSTTTLYTSAPTAHKDTEALESANRGSLNKELVVAKHHKQRNPPLVEPILARFKLSPELPKLLQDLHVYISTDESNAVLQYSVHACPLRMRREMRIVFPEIAGKEKELLIIPTFQKVASSMVSYHPETQDEKDDKLNVFYRWGAELVTRLRKQGYWADITDPMSGMALFTACGPSLYPDVEGAEALLRYRLINIGNCFLLSHPQWGTHVYPATAFTLAPADVLMDAINSMQLKIHS